MLDRGGQDALTCALHDSLYYANVYESYVVVYGRRKQGKMKRLLREGFHFKRKGDAPAPASVIPPLHLVCVQLPLAADVL